MSHTSDLGKIPRTIGNTLSSYTNTTATGYGFSISEVADPCLKY